MKWFFNRCRRRREISLFAAGALPEPARSEMEQHLAACSCCRAYFKELRALAGPLAGWEKDLAQIEPTQAMQMRWARAVQACAAESAGREPRLKNLWHNLWLEVIWPYRRGWIGLATVWVALLAANARLPGHPMRMAGAGSSPGGASIELWEETHVLVELAQPGIAISAPMRAPATLPATPPRPRSSRKPDWQMV